MNWGPRTLYWLISRFLLGPKPVNCGHLDYEPVACPRCRYEIALSALVDGLEPEEDDG